MQGESPTAPSPEYFEPSITEQGADLIMTVPRGWDGVAGISRNTSPMSTSFLRGRMDFVV